MQISFKKRIMFGDICAIVSDCDDIFIDFYVAATEFDHIFFDEIKNYRDKFAIDCVKTNEIVFELCIEWNLKVAPLQFWLIFDMFRHCRAYFFCFFLVFLSRTFNKCVSNRLLLAATD